MGRTVTAYFLEHCNSLQDGFAAAFNWLMKDSYSDDYFVQLLGKNDSLQKKKKTLIQRSNCPP